MTLHIGGRYVDDDLQRQWKIQLSNYDLDNVDLKVVNLSSKELDEAANKLFEMVKTKKVSIDIFKKYHLKDVVNAHKDLEGRKIIGPAIIVPN